MRWVTGSSPVFLSSLSCLTVSAVGRLRPFGKPKSAARLDWIGGEMLP